MDNVQLENGYTAVANEILEKIAQVKLSPTQYRIIFVVWRFTYGFRRKEHSLSLSFIAKATGCDKRQIQREVSELIKDRFLIQKSVKSVRVIRFNKHYSQWFKGLPVGEIDNGETVNGETAVGESVVAPVGEIDNSPVGEIDNQENNIKTNIKTIYSRLFDFWNSKKIIVHKKLNDKTKQKITKLLETYTCEDIEKSILNYEIVLHQDKYYWSYAWTLEEFLQRGFEKFLSETCFTNFLTDKQNSSQVKKMPQAGNFDQRNYDDEYFDNLDKEV